MMSSVKLTINARTSQLSCNYRPQHSISGGMMELVGAPLRPNRGRGWTQATCILAASYSRHSTAERERERKNKANPPHGRYLSKVRADHHHRSNTSASLPRARYYKQWHFWHHYHHRHHHRSSSRIFTQHSQAVGKKGSRAFGKAWVATTMRIDLYHMTIASVTRHSWVDAARLVRISTTQKAAKKNSRRCKTAGNVSTPSMRYIAKCYNTSCFFQ